MQSTWMHGSQVWFQCRWNHRWTHFAMSLDPWMDTFCNVLGSMDPGVVPMPMEPQMDKFWNLFGSMHERIHNRYIQIFSLTNIPDEKLMVELGLELGINANVIKACLKNNSGNIELAVFDMLYHKWYHTQDGLGLNSRGLCGLKQALLEVGKVGYIETILERHFENR